MNLCYQRDKTLINIFRIIVFGAFQQPQVTDLEHSQLHPPFQTCSNITTRPPQVWVPRPNQFCSILNCCLQKSQFPDLELHQLQAPSSLHLKTQSILSFETRSTQVSLHYHEMSLHYIILSRQAISVVTCKFLLCGEKLCLWALFQLQNA